MADLTFVGIGRYYLIILLVPILLSISTNDAFAQIDSSSGIQSESNQSIVIGGTLYPIIIENPAPSPSTLFGLSTSISENRLLIKAQKEENVVDEFGNYIRKVTQQMFLFDCSQLTECTLVDTIVNPSPQLEDIFGTYSKMDWPYVVITAWGSDVDIDNDGSLENEIGVAYFYDCSGNSCSLVDTISNPNPEEQARFGRFISMSGTLVAISNPYEDIDGVPDAGQVYLFDCSGNKCSLVDTISNPDPKDGARFGNFISISGSLVAISHQQYMQVVYLYDCSGNSCSLVDTLQDPKNENEDTSKFGQFGFGTAGVVLVNHTLAVSDTMAGEDIDGSGIIESDETRFGEVYLYDCSGNGCSLFETLKNPTPKPSDSFGEFFSMQSENRILVGAPHAGERGEVYFFNEQVTPIESKPELILRFQYPSDDGSLELSFTGIPTIIRDESGHTVISGEVKNEKHFAISNVKIHVKFLDENGNSLESITGTTAKTIEVFSQSSFEITSVSANLSIVEAKVTLVGFNSAEPEPVLEFEPESTTEPEPVSETIVEPEKLKIAPFVDLDKDPQYYIDRYNNEPSYKKWFHDNYPQYDSIEQAVGLELTQKIPDWVKNIFGWYAQDQIGEEELLNAIKYLINEGILVVE